MTVLSEKHLCDALVKYLTRFFALTRYRLTPNPHSISTRNASPSTVNNPYGQQIHLLNGASCTSRNCSAPLAKCSRKQLKVPGDLCLGGQACPNGFGEPSLAEDMAWMPRSLALLAEFTFKNCCWIVTDGGTPCHSHDVFFIPCLFFLFHHPYRICGPLLGESICEAV
ncbi:hypothetical protein BC829DRAFT_90236 [Chytridium lagenaria]|nr:hypothetical protein BC829DRAFT_90236 [Chytridium lagenaria]